MKLAPGWYVEMFSVAKLEKRLGPFNTESLADRCDRGVNINLDHERFYTCLVEYMKGAESKPVSPSPFHGIEKTYANILPPGGSPLTPESLREGFKQILAGLPPPLELVDPIEYGCRLNIAERESYWKRMGLT